MTAMDNTTPITFPLVMEDEDLFQMMHTAMGWGLGQAVDVEQGFYEPLSDDREIRMDWNVRYAFKTYTDLLIAKSYLIARGAEFQVLFDTLAAEGNAEEIAEGGQPDWPTYLLLTNYGHDEDYWGPKCESCGLRQPNHFGDCPRYADYAKEHPQSPIGPVPPRLRGVTVVALPAIPEED